ncbi:MAG TPA: hypothetical protein VEL76_31760, partial [Gemmataceae bacterium]|nr:hypothetical protein [Gemmataceae bacterium]
MRAFPPFGEPVQARRGMILLIVITLLTLFAVTGLSFVFYAESEARSAKAFREAADNYRPDVDPETALAFFLGKLIYGETNDTAGSASALRGHDLTGGAYGHNYAVNASGQLVLNPTAPFTGTGRTHVLNTAGVIAGLDDYRLINYTWFKADGFLRDPARLGTRTDPTATLGTYTGGFNVPWTYPDLNNMYLGAVRADGTVLTPSFHREYLFGRLDDPANPNWTSPEGKYLTLRPRPADHLGFPFPEGRFGDVQNLPWGTGGPDSIWIDIGAPVITAPDGRKYKMLVAPLIIDLDGRINLNVAGNIKNAGAYTGRQGWGRWEINVNKVLPVTAETPNLFKGRTQTSGTNIKNLQGRYAFGAAGPAGTPLPPPGAGQFYSPFDFDGSATAFPTLPAGTTSVWPTYVAGYDNGTAAELANHPGGFDYFAAARGGSANRLLPVSDMEALLRYRDKGSPAMYSETFDLLPRNFNPATSAATARVRGLVTHRSMDFATPGQVAWLWNPTTAGYAYNYVATNPNANFPTGPAIPFPTILPRQAPPAGSEFDANWQAIPAVIQRLDLNRKLTNYPAPDPATGLMDLSIAANQTAFTNAQNDRQQFARDIYNLLVKVTGARDPNTDAAVRDAVPNQAAFRAARWLAHLAVNIVDYIDNDDYMTPFNWFGAEWVFGTELPRLVLNEAYAQYDNDGDPSGFTLVNTVKTATHYQLNVWLELHNPFKTMTDPSRDNGTAVLQSPSGQSAYRLLLTKPNTNLRDPANLRGDPDTAANQVLNAVTNWGPTAVQQTVLPANGATSGPAGSNQGFYVLGPQATYLPNRNPNIPVTFASSSMSTLYPGNTTAAQAPTAAANHPTILLQRLACPHLPFNATTNPYITTDYMENLPVNENREYRPTVIAGVPLPTTRTSVGRRQPWAGWAGTTNSQRAAQTTVVAGQPNNTFYSQNVPATSPYQWLVHLDRQLISPMELL